MMTTRKRGGTLEFKCNREAKGNEEYDYTTYYGEEISLRSSLFESEKQQFESRISKLESRNKVVEWKNTALVVSITVLMIATLTISIVHQINIQQLNTEINLKKAEGRQLTFPKADEDWKVS